jgi:tetratricopeptide (TPR) repeat protein
LTLEPGPISDAPSPDDIRAAVNRMVMSDVFSRSVQLGAFLRYVVEAVLKGKSDRIKAYTIAIEVLRRDAKFDPQVDPIVRVEATRLRRAIERYYSGAGMDDVIIIELPRGSYVPTFRFRDRADVGRSLARNPLGPFHMPFGVRPLLASIVALAIVGVTIVAGAVLYNFIGQPVSPGGPLARNVGSLVSEGSLGPGNGMPTLAVQKFDNLGTPDPRSLSASALLEKLRDAFARFDAINIASESLRAGERIDYRLLGFIEYHEDATISVRFRLQDVGDGNVVWTRAFDRRSSTADRSTSEDEIVSEVATTLLQPFGIIRSRERVKNLTINTGDPRYRCLLLTSDAFRSFDPAEHDLARSCLEHLIAISPSFGDGFSYLASLCNREFLYGFGKSADHPDELDRALQLARRGVELAPASARAYQVLSTVLFSRRDTTAAFAAVERAMDLNPYDSIIAGEYGGRLITAGEIERGMNVLRRVEGNSGVLPSWHHFYLFLGSYLTDDLTAATRQAAEMTSDTYPHALVARALVAAANGDREKAQLAWERLVALRSAWRANPRGELEKYISAPSIVDRLVRDLTAAGLTEGR